METRVYLQSFLNNYDLEKYASLKELDKIFVRSAKRIGVRTEKNCVLLNDAYSQEKLMKSFRLDADFCLQYKNIAPKYRHIVVTEMPKNHFFDPLGWFDWFIKKCKKQFLNKNFEWLDKNNHIMQTVIENKIVSGIGTKKKWYEKKMIYQDKNSICFEKHISDLTNSVESGEDKKVFHGFMQQKLLQMSEIGYMDRFGVDKTISSLSDIADYQIKTGKYKK